MPNMMSLFMICSKLNRDKKKIYNNQFQLFILLWDQSNPFGKYYLSPMIFPSSSAKCNILIEICNFLIEEHR